MARTTSNSKVPKKHQIPKWAILAKQEKDKPVQRISDHQSAILRSHVFGTWRDDEMKQEENDWLSFSELPQVSELMPATSDSRKQENGDLKTGRPDLPTNTIDGPWESTSGYLSTHYRLNREDAIGPLRSAVQRVRRIPNMAEENDVSIYTKVHITGYVLSHFGPAVQIEFNLDRTKKRVNWAQTSRLRVGTVVALTPENDMFNRICKVAIVAGRCSGNGIDRDPPCMELLWADLNEAEIDSTVSYVMVESRACYFESSRYMLLALQKLSTESFPLQEYMASITKAEEVPGYVLENPLRNIETLNPSSNSHSPSMQNMNILERWPDMEAFSFNESQRQALERILTKKVAVIQGPPGTGKTFVSVNALKIMLDNMVENDPPIIISAETNHALDQLLALVAPYLPDEAFVRLGSRYNKDNEIIHRHSLHELRLAYNSKVPRTWPRKKAAQANLSTQYEDLQFCIEHGIGDFTLDPASLVKYKIISQEQHDSLVDLDWQSDGETVDGSAALCDWVGDQLIPSPYHCAPCAMRFDADECDSEYEEATETALEGLEVDDSREDSLRGNFVTLREDRTGKHITGWSDAKIRQLLSTTSDLFEIKPQLRGCVYAFFQRQLRKAILPIFREKAERCMMAVQKLRYVRTESDFLLLKSLGIKLIACTTTGLAKYRGLLAAMSPRILLIEEAAQCLEARVLSGMFESLEHLVLVGDHQQLPAHCNIRALDKPPYSLTMSAFERLVRNGFEYSMLNEQRRMIPEIRQTLSIFYPTLRDHHSVSDASIRPPIAGMQGYSTYFYNHTYPEVMSDLSSWQNKHEADMIVEQVNYLMLNGTDLSKITILTYYRGQRSLIVRLLKRHRNFASYILEGKVFKVYTVDSYQGEENDVILLSLVRSNAKRIMGFVDNENRAVVALSRARRGLYIFGNISTLLLRGSRSFDLWAGIVRRYQENERLGNRLPVVCSKHETTVWMRSKEDWKQTNGGCTVECGENLPCGHKCLYKCHPFSHDELECRKNCNLVLSCGHKCDVACGKPCACSYGCNALTTTSKPIRSEGSDSQDSLDDVLSPSDEQIEHQQRSYKIQPNSGPIFNDTFIPIDVRDGERIIKSHEATFEQILPKSRVIKNLDANFEELHIDREGTRNWVTPTDLVQASESPAGLADSTSLLDSHALIDWDNDVLSPTSQSSTNATTSFEDADWIIEIIGSDESSREDLATLI